MKVFQRVFAFLLCLGVTGAMALEDGQSPKEEVAQVIEAFRTAIIDKDEQKFVDLFYEKGIPWIGVEGAKRSGMLPSQSGIYTSSYRGFISWVVSTEKKAEEKFQDVHIITDGEIASVHFKYSFYEDDYKRNWGDEAWQLVNTADGWKIVSVIYSIEKNPEPQPKKG